MTKMAAMPIYDKNFKKPISLLNQKVDELETWYLALAIRVLPNLCNDDLVLTMTYLKTRSALIALSSK